MQQFQVSIKFVNSFFTNIDEEILEIVLNSFDDRHFQSARKFKTKQKKIQFFSHAHCHDLKSDILKT